MYSATSLERSFSGTRAARQQRYILMSQRKAYRISGVPLMIYKKWINYDQKIKTTPGEQ